MVQHSLRFDFGGFCNFIKLRSEWGSQCRKKSIQKITAVQFDSGCYKCGENSGNTLNSVEEKDFLLSFFSFLRYTDIFHWKKNDGWGKQILWHLCLSGSVPLDLCLSSYSVKGIPVCKYKGSYHIFILSYSTALKENKDN